MIQGISVYNMLEKHLQDSKFNMLGMKAAIVDEIASCLIQSFSGKDISGLFTVGSTSNHLKVVFESENMKSSSLPSKVLFQVNLQIIMQTNTLRITVQIYDTNSVRWSSRMLHPLVQCILGMRLYITNSVLIKPSNLLYMKNLTNHLWNPIILMLLCPINYLRANLCYEIVSWLFSSYLIKFDSKWLMVGINRYSH